VSGSVTQSSTYTSHREINHSRAVTVILLRSVDFTDELIPYRLMERANKRK
jgi:hypothetical protein